MRKIVAISGEPGTGKTTLMRKFIDQYFWEKREDIKLVNSLYSEELDLHIIGKYEEGEIFAGTDKLSMAVQPSVVEFINGTNSNILFEGDRLTNFKFFDYLMNLSKELNEVNLLILTVPQTVMEERYKVRGSDQSETFLKGRKTKISNIRSNFEYMDYITVFENKDENDQNKILEKLNSIFK
jgi:hypothetical protein